MYERHMQASNTSVNIFILHYTLCREL